MAKKPCRVCHQVLPATAFQEKHNGTCTLTCVPYLAEQRPYQQAYHRGYRQTHQEQRAKRKQEYQEQHKHENAAYQRQYYVSNTKRLAARKHAYYQQNREKELARRRHYYDTNRVQATARRRHYYWENRDTMLARKQRSYHEQQARKRSANTGASPSKDGSSNRKKADAANEQER